MAVRVRNTSNSPYRDKFDGEEYVIGPGEVALVPDGAAALWLGVGPDGVVVEGERRRAAMRRGGLYPPLVVAGDEAPPAPRTYTCDVCGETFDHHMRLKAHVAKEHPPDDDEDDGDNEFDEDDGDE